MMMRRGGGRRGSGRGFLYPGRWCVLDGGASYLKAECWMLTRSYFADDPFLPSMLKVK